MTYPLTFASRPHYSVRAGANHQTGLAARVLGGQPPLSGFFTSVIQDTQFMGGSCGREKSLPVLARSANPHVSAHPFSRGQAENINRLARSITMPQVSSRASAHRFVVVSNLPRASIYTGTKEQLIALGVARPEQFPEGRKRVNWDFSVKSDTIDGWTVKKLKGGYFELKRNHKRIAPKAATVPFGKFSITYSPEGETDDAGPYLYEAYSNVGKLNDQIWSELWAAADGVIKVMEKFNAHCRKNPSYLRLVKSSPTLFSEPLSVSAEVQHG